MVKSYKWNHGLLPSLVVTFVAFGCASDDKAKEKTADGKDVVAILPSGKEVPGSAPLIPEFSFAQTPYEATSQASAADIKARIDASNAFHFSLMKKIGTDRNDNLVVSGFSVQTAFSLLYPGVQAGTPTASEFSAALGFAGDQNNFAEAMKGQLLAVEQAFEPTADMKKDAKLTYNLVNQVWTDTAYTLQDDFLTTIRKYYNAGVGSLPLATKSEDSRQTINEFVAHNTNGLIRDLIPPNIIDASTAAVLTNSVYMLADWLVPFEKESTAAAAFKNADGTSANPETMRQTKGHDYAEGDGFQALSLPYVGDKVAMLIVLPDAGTISTFEDSFDAASYRQVLDSLKYAQVSVSLPRFEIEWGTYSLKEALTALGMSQVFDPAVSNFPNLLLRDGVKVEGSYIQNVMHKAKIIVDEKGTEAAAATAIVVGVESAAEVSEPKIFKVDRPALFYIYEKEGGTILFGGRLAKL